MKAANLREGFLPKALPVRSHRSPNGYDHFRMACNDVAGNTVYTIDETKSQKDRIGT